MPHECLKKAETEQMRTLGTIDHIKSSSRIVHDDGLQINCVNTRDPTATARQRPSKINGRGAAPSGSHIYGEAALVWESYSNSQTGSRTHQHPADGASHLNLGTAAARHPYHLERRGRRTRNLRGSALRNPWRAMLRRRPLFPRASAALSAGMGRGCAPQESDDTEVKRKYEV